MNYATILPAYTRPSIMQRKTHYSIVIPVFNEKESLPELLTRLNKLAKKNEKFYEFIFIDDGSTDGSFETLLQLKKKTKSKLKIIQFRKNLGKSAALDVAFNEAKGDIIVTLDADLQDDPAEIPKLIQKIDTGFDLVVGWRKERKDQKNKVTLSHFFNSVIAKIYKLPLHDNNCGLKALKKSVAQEIDLYGELHRFIPVLAVKRGFKVTEVSIIHYPRKFGESKFGKGRIIHAFFDLITTIFLTSFKNSPMQIFGLTGVLFTLIGIIILLYLSFIHFSGHSIIGRPLLFLGILFVLFGVQFFSTGFIGELITSNNHDHTKRPIQVIID